MIRLELYKNILGEMRFKEIITYEFNPHNNKQPLTQNHLDLIELPFVSFITTNYDCILENAKSRLDLDIKSNFYPTLPISHIRDRQIFHIHGILDYERLSETQDSIIITRSDINQAYQEGSNIYNLLNCAYQELIILFIGFNIYEPFIWEIIRDCRYQYEEKRIIASERGSKPLKEINHFAFLENKLFYPPNKDQYIINHEISDEENIDLIIKQDEELKTIGINPIRYVGDPFNHTQLIELVHKLYSTIKNLQERPIVYDLTFHGE